MCDDDVAKAMEAASSERWCRRSWSMVGTPHSGSVPGRSGHHGARLCSEPARPPSSGSVLFPLGYVWLSSRAFSGPPILQGMLWAGLLWVVAEVIMAPMLSVEVFSPALGGLPAALRALLGYLVYGATLGSIAGAVQPEDRYASHV